MENIKKNKTLTLELKNLNFKKIKLFLEELSKLNNREFFKGVVSYCTGTEENNKLNDTYEFYLDNDYVVLLNDSILDYLEYGDN